MFFVLSKTLIFLLNPMVWFLALLTTGLLSKRKKAKKVLIIIAFSIFYIFSNKFLMNSVVKLWQTKPTEESQLKEKYDYGIVLGGFSSYEQETDVVSFHESVDRLMFALQLYYQGKIDKILISSGSANLINDEYKEADFIKDYLLSIGFPQKNLVIENQSKNTYENAKFTANLLKDELDTADFLLITSAMHMKRANACFEKQGIYAHQYVVEYLTGFEDLSIVYYVLPKFDVIIGWQWIFHEIAGYYIYKIAGYL